MSEQGEVAAAISFRVDTGRMVLGYRDLGPVLPGESRRAAAMRAAAAVLREERDLRALNDQIWLTSNRRRYAEAAEEERLARSLSRR